MQNASNGFIDALRWGSTIIASQVTVYYKNQPTSFVLPVSDGTFTIDRNSEFRRTGSLTVEILPDVPPVTTNIFGTERTVLPLHPQAILSPFGNEVSVSISLVQVNSSNQAVAGANGWVPLGLYEIASSVVDDTGIDLTVTLDLKDRSWAIAQRTLKTSYSVPAADGTLQGELEALVTAAWGGTPPWQYNIIPDPLYTVPAGTYNQGQDPWQAALDIFAAAGYELYFDVNGNVVGHPIPDPTQQPVVWNFTANSLSDLGTMTHSVGSTPYTTPVDMQLTMTRDTISNDFIVVATGPNNASAGATPVQGQAADTNPQFPTWIGGPMGDVLTVIYDSNITSQAQAQAEAEYDLSVSLSKSWVISVDTPPNPLFDVDDVVTATNPRLALNAQKFVLDTISTSIRYDAVTTVTGRTVV